MKHFTQVILISSTVFDPIKMMILFTSLGFPNSSVLSDLFICKKHFRVAKKPKTHLKTVISSCTLTNQLMINGHQPKIVDYLFIIPLNKFHRNLLKCFWKLIMIMMKVHWTWKQILCNLFEWAPHDFTHTIWKNCTQLSIEWSWWCLFNVAHEVQLHKRDL